MTIRTDDEIRAEVSRSYGSRVQRTLDEGDVLTVVDSSSCCAPSETTASRVAVTKRPVKSRSRISPPSMLKPTRLTCHHSHGRGLRLRQSNGDFGTSAWPNRA